MRMLTLFLLLAPLWSLAQLTIKGDIKGLPDGALITLHANDPNSEPVAKGTSKGGKFTLTPASAEPNIYILNYAAANKRLVLFLENVPVTIEGTANSFENLIVKGSSANTDFQAFNNELSPLYRKLSAAAQAINSGNQGAAVRKEYEQTLVDIQAKTDQFVTARPNSFVSPFVILVATQLNTEYLVTEARYNKLSPRVQQGKFGVMLRDAIAEGKIGAIGTEALNFTQNDPNGTPVSLASFRGKYVLVDFWASWCKPCRAENPTVVKAFHTYKDKNFTVLGVSLDRAREPWLKAIEDDKLTWTQVSDLKFWNNEAAKLYKIEAIPQNYLLDPKGMIIGKNLRGEELLAKLKELLN